MDILKPKRGRHSTIESINPVLEEGEIVFEKQDDGSTGRGTIKMGDGHTAYNDLEPFLSFAESGGVEIRTSDPDPSELYDGKMWIVSSPTT